MKCEELRKIYSALMGERRTIEGIWSDIERLIWPFRGDMYKSYETEHEVRWHRGEIYDSTGIESNNNLASSIQGAIIPSGLKWFDLTFRDPAIRKNREALIWLEECGWRVYFAIQLSNFNIEAGELIADLTSFGSAAMAAEVLGPELQMRGMGYKSIPIRECYFETDHNDKVLRFFRELNWTPLQIFSKFGKDTPEDIQEKANKAGTSREKIIFAIYPRPGTEGANLGMPLNPLMRPFGYKYFRLKDATRLGKEGGYYEMPIFFPKWRRSVGSKWGYSPGMMALPDVMTANREIQLIFRAGEKAIDPPTVVPDRGLLSDLDLSASGLTVARDPKSIVTLQSQTRLDFTNLLLMDVRESIRSKFYVDQLKLREADRMTTVEVQMRYEQMQRLFGPTLGRIQNDWLDDLIGVTFSTMFRAGLLPPPPRVVVEQQAEMDIEYLGPMARAQKMDMVASIERWIGSIASLAEIYPELRDLPKIDEVGMETAQLMNVPAHLIRGPAELKTIRDERQAKMEEQEKMAKAQMMSEVAKNAGQAIGAAGTGADTGAGEQQATIQ